MPRNDRQLNPHPLTRPIDRYGAKAVGTSGSTIVGPMRGHTVAQAIHDVIQQMVLAGHREPAAGEIFAVASAHPLAARRAVSYQQIARRRLTVGAAVYFAHHRLGADWTVLGVQGRPGGGPGDITWGLTGDQVLVDELKAERITLTMRQGLRRQVERQLADGRAAWGEGFLGVRLCVLGDPRLSRFVSADDVSGPVTGAPR